MPRYIELWRWLGALLFALGVADGFGRPKCHKQHRKSSTIMTPCNSMSTTSQDSLNEEPNEVTTIHCDPYYHCGRVGFGVVQKIPYETFTRYDSPIDVNFSAACVRCGICLAIADKINQTLLAVHASMLPNEWLDDDVADFLLRVVCSEQFRHYALREIDGDRYIGDNTPGAVLIVTTADGFWETNLRKKCDGLLNEVGPRELYKQWRDWYEKSTDVLTDVLCRGESGGLRDCRSIGGDGKRLETCQNVYHAGIKLSAKIG